MKIIHGHWAPDTSNDFFQSGHFSIWVESDEIAQQIHNDIHPQHLRDDACLDFLKTYFSLSLAPNVQRNNSKAAMHTLLLPTLENSPLPCPELAMPEMNSNVALQAWQVYSFPLAQPLKNIGDIYFLSHFQYDDVKIGSDFLFWYYLSQSLKQFFYKDQYLPALLAQQSGKKTHIYRSWKISSPDYESLITQAVQSMPLICSQTYDAESLLRHFCEVIIQQILDTSSSQLPRVFNNKLKDDFLATLLQHPHSSQAMLSTSKALPGTYTQYQQWLHKLVQNDTESTLQLGFQLYEADVNSPDNWRLNFFISSHKDPSLQYDLADFWTHGEQQEDFITALFGDHISPQILINLAQAAKIYPKLWSGMDSAKPSVLSLSLDEAFEFLHESAWVLEDTGFKIIIPSRLSPKGRQRAKMRMRSKSKQESGSKSASSYLSMQSLIDYQYQLVLGDELVSPEEWQQLVESKSPLVLFRGQWIQLDREKMQEMLQFWQQQQDSAEQVSIQELLQKIAEQDGDLEVDAEDNLAEMLSKLNDSSQLQLIENPEQLHAQLRAYQKRGVSWLRYLESLGLNGCLADDMGLGKTMQVIANLVLEKTAGKHAPTLLIAPTSVIGNWQKEVQKFAPHLQTYIHHGAQREKDKQAFAKNCAGQDMLITSYTLARKDCALLTSLNWHRIVLDEAQNIKNPKAAQTKAILKLKAQHRLALTGTPVENRLMDLWSIFNFLNPNYLGKQTQFRKNYEIPVQRDNNLIRSNMLKQLIQPFILRRLKTDKDIIKDLPDKIESKLYCNLSKEQASLYQAVVQDVEQQLQEKEGIERQGLMLSTLMRLKQICNHPMQYLQDESPFTAERSHKLERLSAMLQEAIDEGDSVLVFTQFTEIGAKLHEYLLKSQHLNSSYLHGGVSRAKREQLITEFQNPDTPASVFILSLKAGGVGITLTRANHVFHFDRWWNPAVENQATDRAFRIGQQKNVFVHKFVTLGTLEERIDEMIEDKQKMADSIIGNDESWLTKLDNQAFKELIALNKDSIIEA